MNERSKSKRQKAKARAKQYLHVRVRVIRAGTPSSLVHQCGFEDGGKQGRQIVGPRAQRFEVPRHREIHLRGVAVLSSL